MEFDDVFQDASLIFLECCDKYPNVVNAAHFMRLYTVSVCNHMHDLAKSATKHRREVNDGAVAADTEASLLDLVVRESADPYELQEFLEHPEYGAVSQQFSSFSRKPKYRRNSGKREHTDEYICRVAKIPYRSGIASELKDQLERV